MVDQEEKALLDACSSCDEVTVRRLMAKREHTHTNRIRETYESMTGH